jgi:hypothetical protein
MLHFYKHLASDSIDITGFGNRFLKSFGDNSTLTEAKMRFFGGEITIGLESILCMLSDFLYFSFIPHHAQSQAIYPSCISI